MSTLPSGAGTPCGWCTACSIPPLTCSSPSSTPTRTGQLTNIIIIVVVVTIMIVVAVDITIIILTIIIIQPAKQRGALTSSRLMAMPGLGRLRSLSRKLENVDGELEKNMSKSVVNVKAGKAWVRSSSSSMAMTMEMRR
jgi:hypothetical protein